MTTTEPTREEIAAETKNLAERCIGMTHTDAIELLKNSGRRSGRVGAMGTADFRVDRVKLAVDPKTNLVTDAYMG